MRHDSSPDLPAALTAESGDNVAGAPWHASDVLDRLIAARDALLVDVPPAERAEFGQRLEASLPTLHDRLMRLYAPAFDADSQGFATWFERTWTRLCALITARPAHLKRVDLARRRQPDWFVSEAMVGYSAYVDRFAGDLTGMQQRIPHLKSLGVTYLHLLPFLKARAGANDGGFAVASFDEIEPRLGTMADLERLTDTLRTAGISLCSDFILNHVADDHPWAQAARAGDPVYRQFFHCFDDRQLPDQYERDLVQIFPQTAPGNFSWVEPMQAWVWTTFYPYQWDLNYANPEVFAEVALALLRLANRGIDAFRLDSTGFLWKRLGTACMNQPEAHWILQALRAVMDIAAPGVLLKAEAIVPTRDLPPYFGVHDLPGRECHLAYHSSLMSASWVAMAEQNTDLLRRVLRSTPELPQAATWLTYVRCHDDIGWNVLRPDLQQEADGGQARLSRAVQFFAGELPGSYAQGRSFQSASGGVHGSNGMAAALLGIYSAQDGPNPDADRELAVRRYLLMLGLAATMGGMPMLYMGDEMALGNDTTTPIDLDAGIDGRQLHRPDFPGLSGVSHADAASQTPAVDGLLIAPVMATMLTRVRALLAVRKALPELSGRKPMRVLDAADPAHLLMLRGQGMVIEQNWSERELPAADLDSLVPVADLAPAGHVWRDALTGAVRPAGLDAGAASRAALPAYSQRWWVLEPLVSVASDAGAGASGVSS